MLEAFAIALHSRIKSLARNLEKFFKCLEARDCQFTFERHCKPWLSRVCSRSSICTSNGLLPEVDYITYSWKCTCFIAHSSIENGSKLWTYDNISAKTYQQTMFYQSYIQQISRGLAITKGKVSFDPWGSYYAISWIRPFSTVHSWFFSSKSFFGLNEYIMSNVWAYLPLLIIFLKTSALVVTSAYDVRVAPPGKNEIKTFWRMQTDIYRELMISGED